MSDVGEVQRSRQTTPPPSLRWARICLYVQGAIGILGVLVGLLLAGLAAGSQNAEFIAVGLATAVLSVAFSVFSFLLASRIATARPAVRTGIIVLEAVAAAGGALQAVTAVIASKPASVGSGLVALAIAIIALAGVNTTDARTWFRAQGRDVR